MEDKENIDLLGKNLVKNNNLYQNLGKDKGKVLTSVTLKLARVQLSKLYKAMEFASNERKRLAKCTKEAFIAKISMVASVVARFSHAANVDAMGQAALEKLKSAQTRYSVQLETAAQKIVNEYAVVSGSQNSTVVMVEAEKRLKQDLKLFEQQKEAIEQLTAMVRASGESTTFAHDTSRSGYIDLNVDILNARDDIQKKMETLAKLSKLVKENNTKLQLNNVVSNTDVFCNALASFLEIESVLGIFEKTKIIDHLRAEIDKEPSQSK